MTAPAADFNGRVRWFHYEGEFDYCPKCGLVNERAVVNVGGYDPETGHAIQQVRFRCPNKRWWNGHTDQFTIPLSLPPDVNVVADTPEAWR